MELSFKDYREKIDLYISELKKFNRTINLISRKDIDQIKARHIDDSEYSFRLFRTVKRISDEYSLYDLGSGNGLPGVVWAILDPRHSTTLVEIDQRKSEFLKYIVHKLKMTHVNVYCGDFRGISYPKNAIFIMRSFMKIYDFLSESPFEEGFFIKGSTWNMELGVDIEKGIESNKKISVKIDEKILWSLKPIPYTLKTKQDRVLVYGKRCFGL